MHLIQQISNAMIAALRQTVHVEDRVFEGKPKVLEGEDLPAISLVMGVDRAEYNTLLFPRVVSHTVSVDVVIYVKETETAEAVTQIRLDVEKALIAIAPNMSGLTTDIRCMGAEQREDSFESETPISALQVNYEVDFRNLETSPDQAF